MHAFLIVNNTNNKPISEIEKIVKIEKIQKLIPFTLQKIEDVRELKKLVKFSFSEKTAILIENIDSATPEASNAFLKNLEEPTKNIIYILTASNLSNVLPTISSRCQIMRSSSAIKAIDERLQMTKNNTNYKDALNIKDRDEAIKFIESMIHVDHEKNNFNNMENYLTTLKNLKANGNVSLQLTAFVVRMNGYGR